MSIAFSGCRTRSGGWISSIAKQVRLANLKPLRKITVRFDPFHHQVAETRDFLFQLSTPKLLETNPACDLRTEIACDRSDPVVTCEYETGDERLVIKSANLTAIELLKIFNQHVSSRVKPVEEEEVVIVKKKGKKR